ncbi:MAG: class I SAM-dependent methyltransferase [Anaerolineae bacterium]|nr:class I SAM-dependent methyltransferase [Anaerolineae bacterium]
MSVFVCPTCRSLLQDDGPDAMRCPEDGAVFTREGGIWRFLRPERANYFGQFIAEYEAVRRAEGRGAGDPAYYRALPFADTTGRFRTDWRIRAKSYQAFVRRALAPLERLRRRPLAVVDLGAGNGWLSYRLAARGHQVIAVDLLTNPFDGLGASIYYDVAFTPVQAEFDYLPLERDQVDLAVFNSSLHYATDAGATLREALRVMRRDGRLVVMDSPIYHDPASGAQMVREREAHFAARYGFRSDALPHVNFLTYQKLGALAEALGLKWRIIRPFYGLRWALRPLRARLRGHREPAQFAVIVGERRA